jgi:putative FmdB family regulatory protein
MPIYEYRCQQGHNFEVMQRMSDDPVVSCETCAAPVERVFRPVAVHFKGSGFYNTDYGTRKRSRELKEAGEGSGKNSKDDGSSSSKSNSDSSDGAKSESKSKSESSSAAASSSSD